MIQISFLLMYNMVQRNYETMLCLNEVIHRYYSICTYMNENGSKLTKATVYDYVK